MFEERSGWVTFAGILLLIAGSLNVIYGVGAIGDASVFTQDARYVFGNLRTWGWIVLGIGLLQVLAAGSLWRGGAYGRIVGVVAAGASACGALLSIPAYPFWSLAIFALDIVIIHQICARGTEGRAADDSSVSRSMQAMGEYRQ